MVTKKAKGLPLPKHVRDELRMTVALRAYSALKQGGGKKLMDQQQQMANFYHGKGKSHPSQIKLLSEASYTYMDMYDVTVLQATSKSKRKETTRVHTLKNSLTRATRQFTCGKDIRMLDLEKKNRTGDQLLSGR